MQASRRLQIALIAVTVMTFGLVGTANAAAIKFTPNADLTSPFTFSVGNGAASYTFNARNTLFNRPVGVSTGGSGLVTSLGEPFNNPPQPTSYFPNQAFGPDDGVSYVSYNDRVGRIAFSTTDVFVGLKYFQGDDAFYGYARVVGADNNFNFAPRLLSYGFETTANTAIITGEGTVQVAEPSSLALLAAGFGLIGVLGFRRRGESTASPAI